MDSMAALDSLQPRRIALIKPSALGDIINTLPVLTSLRRRFPQAHITWVVNRSYESLLQSHPDLNATLAFNRFAFRDGVFSALSAYASFAHELRRQRFDLVLDLQGLLRTGLMTLATNAPYRIGFRTAREGSRLFYTHALPEPAETHAVERYLSVAAALGGSTEASFRLRVVPEALDWAWAQLKHRPRPWLAVGVGARWQTKRWPPHHFAALVKRALADFGGTAIFVGGRDETALSELAIQQVGASAINLTSNTTLPQLAALLGLSDVMIANDTGPLHLAIALGRPVVAPYTCTQIRYHGPYGQLPHAVETEVACRGSYLRKCPRLHCMTELTPDRLWPILQSILQSWHNSSISLAARLPVVSCSPTPVTTSSFGPRTLTSPTASA